MLLNFRGFTRRAARRQRQALLPFLERRVRLERAFRATILAATALGLGGLWASSPSGRSAATDGAEGAWGAMRRVLGGGPDRAELESVRRDRRERRAAQTREFYRELFAELSPARQSLLRIGGMDPDDALIRWGNYDMSLLFSSRVFERDDAGRYYRLRPNVRSIWFRQLGVFRLDTCQFLLPDTPELRRAAAAAGATPVPGSSQTTNSWGLRGPEPDLSAPVRGLVLGDSFMQGYFVGDEETPPARLQRHLARALGAEVTILNTGLLGYGPEHYYSTLQAYGPRLRPHFLIVAFYANDFGLEPDVLRGEGDWEEAKYWFEKIQVFAMERGIPCLFTPVPYEGQLVSPRNPGHYPGQIANLLKISGALFFDPIDEFANEDIRLGLERGRPPSRSLLYNGALGDCHFSPRGTELWGRLVGERMALLLRRKRAAEANSPPGRGPREGRSTAGPGRESTPPPA